jgi:HSP90 family molecular chaperone
MYQSPVAAIAELVSNAWDADAENVAIRLPGALNNQAVITIQDDGIGMTFAECEDRFLNVGWCRRGDAPGQVSPGKKRPVLGRKGIGKFAGFGIAGVIGVSPVSQENGEKTVFELDLASLRSGDYVDTSGREVNVLEHLVERADRG